MRLIFTLFLLTIYSSISAQINESIIEFAPTFNDLPLELNKNYCFKNDSLKISTLKFYISNINLYQNNQLIDSVSKKYNLIDFENPETSSIKFLRTNSMAFNRISFSNGIDSLTNVSGAFGGDLDPTNGMYWTWQSGYIGLKLEGQSKLCPSRNNAFIFHIGGFKNPYNSIQNVNLSTKGDRKIILNLDISKLLKELNLTEIYEVMSPSKKALTIAQQFSNAIKVYE